MLGSRAAQTQGISQLVAVRLPERQEVCLPQASQQTQRGLLRAGQAWTAEHAAGKQAGLYQTPLWATSQQPWAVHPNCPWHGELGAPPASEAVPGEAQCTHQPPDNSLGSRGLEQACFLNFHREPSSLAGSSAGAQAWPWHLWSQPNRSRSGSALAGTASPTPAAPHFVFRFCSENASW